jgi:hypothetical protein
MCQRCVQVSDGTGATGHQVSQDVGLRLRDFERPRSGQEERDPVRGAMDVRDQIKWHVDDYRILPYRNNTCVTTRTRRGTTDRMAASLRAFARAAGHEQKYHHTLPLAYYSRARLFSGDARERWIEPDVQAL